MTCPQKKCAWKTSKTYGTLSGFTWMLNAKTAEVHRLEVTSTLNQVHHKLEFCHHCSTQWEPARLCRAASTCTKKCLLAWTLKHQRLILSIVVVAKGHSDLWRYNVIFCFNAHGTCWQVKTEWTMQIRKLASFCQGPPARYEEVIPDIPAGSPTSTAESLWTLLQDSSGHIQHSLLNINIQKEIMGDATAAPVWHWGQITKKAAHPNTYRFLGANLLPDSNTKTVSQVLSLNTRSQTRFIKLYIYMKGTLQLGHCSPLSQGKILSASCPIPKQTYQTQTTLNITNLKFSKWSLK